MVMANRTEGIRFLEPNRVNPVPSGFDGLLDFVAPYAHLCPEYTEENTEPNGIGERATVRRARRAVTVYSLTGES